MAKKKAAKRRVRAKNKAKKRAPRKSPFDEIGVATTMPRWILKEFVSGIRVRADYRERVGEWASAAIMREHANKLEAQFLKP